LQALCGISPTTRIGYLIFMVGSKVNGRKDSPNVARSMATLLYLKDARVIWNT